MHLRLLLIALGVLVVTSAPLQSQVKPPSLSWEHHRGSSFHVPGGEAFRPPSEVGGADFLSSGVAAAGLGPTSAAVVGGVVGAGVGYTAFLFHCRDRFCEMGPIVGIIGGAVVGVSVGRVLAEGVRFAPGRR